MSEDTNPEDTNAAPSDAPPEADASAEASSEAEAKPDAEPKTSVQDSKAEAAKPEPAAANDDDDDAVLDAKGRERPRFLLAFPEHPELARLSAAFEAGNYALVRAEAEKLAEHTDDPAVRDAALELRRRIEPDPLAKYLLALTAALLLFLAYFAYHH